MTAKVIVITTAMTIMGGVLALADGSKLQSVNSANVHAMRMDRCPYYPSPVFCRSGPRARTTSGSLTPPQAAVDLEESKIRQAVGEATRNSSQREIQILISARRWRFRSLPNIFAMRESGVDAVDGSSTGARAPWMWVLLGAYDSEEPDHANDYDYRSRYREVGFSSPRR